MYKEVVFDSQLRTGEIGFLSNIIENHDEPRGVSRYIPKADLSDKNKKALAAVYFFLRGIPFIYQGQEIGMLNLRLPDVNMYEDVMTHNAVRIASKIMPKKKVLEMVQRSCRDSARSPMQWSDGENAGFSTGKPWF